MFEIKSFNSGELDIKLIGRVISSPMSPYPIITWNWFKEKDILIPLLKADAIKKQYGDIDMSLKSNYFPYSRQDRVFEAGQPLPTDLLADLLFTRFKSIHTQAYHSSIRREGIWNSVQCIYAPEAPVNIVYPDLNAAMHFGDCIEDCFIFEKKRINNVPTLYLEQVGKVKCKSFLICDDICDGGRTFIKCAEELRRLYGKDIEIKLLIYHAFMTHGLNALKSAGISKILIINPDSFEYVCEKFSDDINYFSFYDKDKELENV